VGFHSGRAFLGPGATPTREVNENCVCGKATGRIVSKKIIVYHLRKNKKAAVQVSIEKKCSYRHKVYVLT
jgi:hypothetical protein